MSADIARAISGFCIVVSVLGIAYLTVAVARMLIFGSRRPSSGGATPPITVFKPLCGLEPQLEDNLASFCVQDYPAFQVIFGVRDLEDPSIAVVQRIIERFPRLDLQLVVDARVHGANAKISNVINMAPRAKHDIFIIADSDMRVERGYLRSVVAAFSDGTVGAVTCLYGGSPLRGTWSALGAMFVNDLFAPSVLVGTALQKMRFCFGATMAVRKDVLERIGGLEALASHLADDELLGRLVSESGRRVVLADAVVHNTIFEPSLKGLWAHELRWARTMKTSRPLGYSFFFISYALPWAVIALLVSRNLLWGSFLVAAALVLRVVLHYAALRALRVRARPTPWLIPIRDALGLAEWVTSFFGRRVRWRDQELRVEADGRLTS